MMRSPRSSLHASPRVAVYVWYETDDELRCEPCSTYARPHIYLGRGAAKYQLVRRPHYTNSRDHQSLPSLEKEIKPREIVVDNEEANHVYLLTLQLILRQLLSTPRMRNIQEANIPCILPRRWPCCIHILVLYLRNTPMNLKKLILSLRSFLSV